MNSRATWLEVLFVVLAILGLVGTYAQVPGYLHLGLVEANVQFWKDTFATPASTFIVVDIFVLGAAVLTWMFAECRRLGIGAGWAWTYFLGSALIGISCFFPLFLAHRQRCIRLQHPEQLAAPAGTDFAGVAINIALVVAIVGYSLTHVPRRAAAAPVVSAPAVFPQAEHQHAQAMKAAGPSANKGIESVKSLGTVPLSGEVNGDSDPVLRVRELVIAAGGVVAVHEHHHRPGVAYVLEGEMTEFRSPDAQPVAKRAGDAAFEWTGVTHWWENRGSTPARALVVDIVPAGT